ncbi:MAG: hypothetical protein QM747_10275 [Nocardioides sp.]
MTQRRPVLPVLIGVAVLVLGANVAYAGDGSGFRLRTQVRSAPLSLDSDVRIAHLNAARLDGLRAGELSRAYRYVLPTRTADRGFQASDLPAGRYQVTFDVVTDETDSTGPAPLCFVTDSRHEFAVIAGGTVVEDTGIVNGSGSVRVARAGEAALVCQTEGAIASPVGVDFRSSLTFTRVRSVRRGTVRPLSQPAARRTQQDWRGR